MDFGLFLKASAFQTQGFAQKPAGQKRRPPAAEDEMDAGEALLPSCCAEPSARARRAAVLPLEAASMQGVRPMMMFLRLGSAPCSSRTATASAKCLPI